MSKAPLSTFEVHEREDLNCLFVRWLGYGERSRFAIQLNEVGRMRIIQNGGSVVQDFRRFQFDPSPSYPFDVADRVTGSRIWLTHNRVAALVSTDLQYGQARMYISRRHLHDNRLVCRRFAEACAFVGAPIDLADPFAD